VSPRASGPAGHPALDFWNKTLLEKYLSTDADERARWRFTGMSLPPETGSVWEG
jgi:hypothetical protein